MVEATTESVAEKHTSHHEEANWVGSTQSLLTTVVIAVFVITFIIQAFQIPTPSMEDTLLVGDYLLVDKLHYGGSASWTIIPYRPVRRNDIIVFHYPVDPKTRFVKRVVGVPGDKVRLINQRVYVNGTLVSEPYVIHKLGDHQVFRDEFPRLNMAIPGIEARWWLQMQKLVEDGQLIVPSGHYFVMGDNRDDSWDSRYWGFVPQENIIGRPLIIYWSLRTASDDLSRSSTAGDKIFHFIYSALHVFQNTRWDRTLRLVR